MKQSALTKTIFTDSYENEQIFNRLIEENNNNPELIEIRKGIAANELKYNNRVLDTKSIKRWLEALKSGKYKEKQFTYTDNFREKIVILKYRQGYTSFSALGVLLEVTKDITGGEWHGEWFVKKGLSFEDWTKSGNSNVHIPPFALEKLGFKTIESDLIPSGDINEIALMNVYLNFTEIAIIIENNYLK